MAIFADYCELERAMGSMKRVAVSRYTTHLPQVGGAADV